MDKTSIIIPTYKEPEVLDLCLKSIISNQSIDNEIIVVVDGFFDLNKSVLQKWKNKIKPIVFNENKGIISATNIGVLNATNEKILIINDDNVLPKNWDIRLNELKYWDSNIYSINQIEPYNSIFEQTHIKDLGRNPSNFDLEYFYQYEQEISRDDRDHAGFTLPILMSRKNFFKLGGWDPYYPHAWLSDNDFFYKAQLNHITCLRAYNLHFYHFVSIATGINKTSERLQAEQKCHDYFKLKWGGSCVRDSNNSINLL